MSHPPEPPAMSIDGIVTISGSTFSLASARYHQNGFVNIYHTQINDFLYYCTDKQWMRNFLDQVMGFYSEPIVGFAKVIVDPSKFQNITDLILSPSVPHVYLQSFMEFLDLIKVETGAVDLSDGSGFWIVDDKGNSALSWTTYHSIPITFVPIGTYGGAGTTISGGSAGTGASGWKDSK